MKLKKSIWLVIILLIILIPLFLYLLNFRLIVFNENFYKKEFSKYTVYETLRDYDIEKINSDVLEYFKDNNRLIKNDFFDEKEKLHLADVKILINNFISLFYIVILLIVILSLILYFQLKNKIKKYIFVVLFCGGVITFLDAFIFWLMIKLNFDFVFSTFHKLFFELGTWTFSSGIVVLYPEGLFYDAILRIVSGTLVMALILIFISFLIRFKKHKLPIKK